MKTRIGTPRLLLSGLMGSIYLFSSIAVFAAPEGSSVPKTILLSSAEDPELNPENPLAGTPLKKTITIRGPEKPIEYAKQPYFPIPPDFYAKSRVEILPENLKTFIEETLIPKEALYFQPGVGMDPESGMPYDHIRLRLKEDLLSEVGNYTAASKLSLLIPYLMKNIQQDPNFKNAPLKPHEARVYLKRTLNTVLKYIQKHPEYGGFIPWVDIRPNGTIAPASTKLPSLDNGQMTWALAAVVAGLEDSSAEELREIASLASTILSYQNYRKFYDPETGLLYGTIQYDTETNQWHGDKTYYLNDMFEGTLAVLWGVLNGQIPEAAWDNLAIPTTEYLTVRQEKITTLAGFRGSFHEHWALAFLPFMDSALGPLYQNYLYAQADYAQRNHMPGFLSTAYDPRGVYRQMGVPSIAYNPVDRSDVSVLYATAMGMLIAPKIAADWISKFYKFDKFVLSYGAVESVGRDGYADIFTADAKGMTLLAASGGVLNETKKYLEEHMYPNSRITMDVKLLELMHGKYKQLLQDRNYRPIYFPTAPFPSPSETPFKAKVEKLPDPGEMYDISKHLQSGHLHGKNVRSVGLKTLEQDIKPDGPISFEYDIPSYYAYFDQWAFRGTYIDQAIRIADMNYLSIMVPTNCDSISFEVEIKSDDITLAATVIDTTQAGILSEDGKWKTIVHKIDPIPESDYKPFNYVSIALHDPRYLLSKFGVHQRKGTVHIEKLWLSKTAPSKAIENAAAQAPGELELIRFWRPTHGALPFYKNDAQALFHFTGGAGWRGGYIPYTNLSKFQYLYLRVRSLKSGCNCFYVELKNEETKLLRYKLPVHIPRNKGNEEWHIFEIPIPPGIRRAFNYFALSDPYGPFEVASILMSKEQITGLDAERVTPPAAGRKPLECEYYPCENEEEE